MSKVNRKKQASNILNTPFPEMYGSGAMLLKYSQAEIDEMRSAEIQARLKAICERDGINFKLLNAEFLKYLFANDPAFKTKPKKRGAGKPSRWMGYDGYKLFVEVDNYQQQNVGHSVLSACRHLVKNKLKGETASNLNRRYHELKDINPFVAWDMTDFNNHASKDVIRKELLKLTADIEKK